MSRKSENIIYSQMQAFAQNFTFIVDAGINVEIKELLDNAREVKNYSFAADSNNHYHILITMNAFSIRLAKKLFLEMLHFLEYSGASFYAKSVQDDSVNILFVSFMENGSGFYMDIIFT